ncbi:hypothetical protein HYALB_00008514 [Hymenoscyphus albidus]|uniref:Uncharacterized protein n=1 Tax=Hymenoscyphus albidus TaxID=595503 RepID=A0A9N9LPB7_9HELO|nr:hypothetical protein HYALB_00008514 [Hymenoscyphus albidus]
MSEKMSEKFDISGSDLLDMDCTKFIDRVVVQGVVEAIKVDGEWLEEINRLVEVRRSWLPVHYDGNLEAQRVDPQGDQTRVLLSLIDNTREKLSESYDDSMKFTEHWDDCMKAVIKMEFENNFSDKINQIIDGVDKRMGTSGTSSSRNVTEPPPGSVGALLEDNETSIQETPQYEKGSKESDSKLDEEYLLYDTDDSGARGR